MGYNTFFPATYNSYGYNAFSPMQQQMFPQPNVQQITPQQTQQPNVQQSIQQPMNGGFVHVQSEQEALQYPVAPGYSVTFRDDAHGLYYSKTMGTNQFEAPQFKKFRLVEVNDETSSQNEREVPSEPSLPGKYNFEDYALKVDLAKLRGQIEALESKFENFSAKPKSKAVKEADKSEQSV